MLIGEKNLFQVNSLYIHFPFCIHLCNYCDFYKRVLNQRDDEVDLFHQYLQRSMVKLKAFMKENQFYFTTLDTVYIGGGTPSLWGAKGAQFLKNFFKENDLELSPHCEFTMEVNPGCRQEEELFEWIKVGVNRFSVGIQSLNSSYLKILDRAHSIEDSYRTLNFFKSLKMNYSLDFMLGLPYSISQNRFDRDIIKELKEVLEYNPNHLSIYVLTIKNHYPHKLFIPDDEFIRQEFLGVSGHLKEQGFHHYEVSNYSLPGQESQHNLKYWEPASVAAIGPSATGLLLADSSKALRFKWKTQEADFVLEELGKEEIFLERLYLNLRTFKGIRPNELFKGKELVKFKEIAQNWERNGYLQNISMNQKYQLTSLGFLMLESLMGDLFRELNF